MIVLECMGDNLTLHLGLVNEAGRDRLVMLQDLQVGCFCCSVDV